MLQVSISRAFQTDIRQTNHYLVADRDTNKTDADHRTEDRNIYCVVYSMWASIVEYIADICAGIKERQRGRGIYNCPFCHS